MLIREDVCYVKFLERIIQKKKKNGEQTVEPQMSETELG